MEAIVRTNSCGHQFCHKCHIRAAWRLSNDNLCWWCHGKPSSESAPEGIEYKIGEHYNMPCYVYVGQLRTFYLPILHSHVGDISGKMHYHLNQQFTPCEFLQMTDTTVQMMLAAPHNENVKIEIKRVLCLRPAEPVIHHRPENQDEFNTLQERMRGQVMVDRVCPHQRCSLKGQSPVVVPDSEDSLISVLICPCHGMCWDAETGEFVHVNKPSLDPHL